MVAISACVLDDLWSMGGTNIIVHYSRQFLGHSVLHDDLVHCIWPMFCISVFCVVHLIAALIVSFPDVAYHLLLVHFTCTLWAFAVADGSYVSKLPIVERYICC